MSECKVNRDILRKWHLSRDFEVDCEATGGRAYQTESPRAWTPRPDTWCDHRRARRLMVSLWRGASAESRGSEAKEVESGGACENSGFCTEAQRDQIYL